MPGPLIFIDFEKAFDSLEWNFLYDCRDVFNFGPNFKMWCIKKNNKTLVCTHPDLLPRICKLVDRKKFGLICFPRLIYCDQEPLLLLNLTVHLFGCTYKAISTGYKIFFTPKSLNFTMGASPLAVAKSIYYIINLLNSFPCSHFCIVTMQKMAARETTIYLLSAFLILKP